MDTTWRGLIFQNIILDYFYTPNFWHALHFSERTCTIILPILASKGAIAVGGEVWLPHIPCIQKRIQRLWTSMAPWFSKHEIADPTNNPLFAASHKVEAQILESGDRFTNGSALLSLDKNFPFIMLRCICSGTRLSTNQSAGCGNLVSELKTNGIRLLRFKIPSSINNSKANTSKKELDKLQKHKLPFDLSAPTGPPTVPTQTTIVSYSCSNRIVQSQGITPEPLMTDDTHIPTTQRDNGRFLNADLLKQYPAPTGSSTGPPSSYKHSLPSSTLLSHPESLSTEPLRLESNNTIAPQPTSHRISSQQQLTVLMEGWENG